MPAVILMLAAAASFLYPSAGFAGEYCVTLPKIAERTIELGFPYTYALRGNYIYENGDGQTPGHAPDGGGEPLKGYRADSPHAKRTHELNGQTICLDMRRLRDDLQQRLDDSHRFTAARKAQLSLSKIHAATANPETVCPRIDNIGRTAHYAITLNRACHNPPDDGICPDEELAPDGNHFTCQ